MMTSYSKFSSQRMTLMSTTTTILIYWYNRRYDIYASSHYHTSSSVRPNLNTRVLQEEIETNIQLAISAMTLLSFALQSHVLADPTLSIALMEKSGVLNWAHED